MSDIEKAIASLVHAARGAGPYPGEAWLDLEVENHKREVLALHDAAVAAQRTHADAVRRSNAALVEALDAERARTERLDALQQIIGGHLQDERGRHRCTREVLAAQLGVEADTEAYDAAFDRAVELLRDATPASPPAPDHGPGNVVG